MFCRTRILCDASIISRCVKSKSMRLMSSKSLSETNDPSLQIVEKQQLKGQRNHSMEKHWKLLINKTLDEVKTFSPKDERNRFLLVWPELSADLVEYAAGFENRSVPKWFNESLSYNVTHGKLVRGLLVVEAYKTLAKNMKPIEKDDMRLAYIIGWCVEMLTASFLILDDIMDQSDTRRGRKCWYKIDDVGLGSITDSLMIENGIYYLLKKHFSNEKCYADLVELFHEATFVTAVGQLHDMKAAGINVTAFNIEEYKTIAENKSSFCTFYMPMALAMYLNGIKSPKIFQQARNIANAVGFHFMAHNDFVDCFGDPADTGRIGTDIAVGKYSWLPTVALQRASESQKEVLKRCYGQKDPFKVEKVKELYVDLMLPHAFEKLDEDSPKVKDLLQFLDEISRSNF